MITWTNAKESAKLAILAGSVPVVMGEAGIGKTQMAKAIANELGMEMFLIEGNLLKDGEVGGQN